MGQEFFINSQELENKVRNLLPSQGGAGAGFDLSASTQIIPIVDLTESAEGSNLRADLQSSISFAGATVFAVNDTVTDVISNTGFWRIIGTSTIVATSTTDTESRIIINDGASSKTIWAHKIVASADRFASSADIDFIVKLEAGDTLRIQSVGTLSDILGSVRQIADLEGNLTAP